MYKKSFASVEEPFFGFFKSSQGAPGAPGIQGAKGDRGLQGIQGVAGVAGPKGDQGIPGVPGVAGPKGDQGIPGVQGLPGIVGMQGDRGIQGIQGDQGIQGIPGNYDGVFDFPLGKGNQIDRGNTGASRALVKYQGSTLVMNYAGDFTGGIRFDGSKFCFRDPVVDASGNLTQQCITAADLQKLYNMIPR